jgi:bacteriorhodopsin
MNELIYTTGIASFVIQILTTIVDTYALSIPTPPSLDVIKSLLWVEYIINFVEGTFYIWMISNFSTIKNITITRYYDWVITTPTMLFTYSMYLLHTRNLEENKNHELFKLINDEKYTLIAIILLNWLMLFFGYMGELGKMSVKLSTFLGFIPFIAMFYIIYEKYSKYSPIGVSTFYYFVFVWGLYGVAALMSYEVKNIMYNILDLFAKNFFGLFLAYVLIYKYVYHLENT